MKTNPRIGRLIGVGAGFVLSTLFLFYVLLLLGELALAAIALLSSFAGSVITYLAVRRRRKKQTA